jgi:plastocyanin
MTWIRRLPTVVTLAAVLVVPACSSSGSSSAGGSAGSGPTTNALTIKNFAFGPKSTTVAVGTTVTWTNKDDTTHTVTSSGAQSFNSGNLTSGKTYSMTFRTPGTYSYMCSIHQYMHGTINVR